MRLQLYSFVVKLLAVDPESLYGIQELRSRQMCSDTIGKYVNTVQRWLEKLKAGLGFAFFVALLSDLAHSGWIVTICFSLAAFILAVVFVDSA